MKGSKKYLVFGKLTITALVFWWVLHKLGEEGRNQLVVNFQHADPLDLALGVGIMFFIMALGVIRWQLLLRVQGIHLSYYRATWITAVGNFFNVFLIGAVGGDVPKAWYATRAAPDHKTQAVLTIALDRIVGLMGLFLLASLVVLTHFNDLISHEKTRPMAYLVLAAFVGAILTLLLSTQRHWITSQPWWEKIWRLVPGKEIFLKLSTAYNLYGKRPGTLILVLSISVMVHLSSVFAAFFIGRSIGVEKVGLDHYLIYVPIINTISAIPVTVGGLGLREQAFTHFFSIHGVPNPLSTALSLLFYGATLTVSMVCGLFYLLGKPKSEVLVSGAETDSLIKG